LSALFGGAPGTGTVRKINKEPKSEVNTMKKLVMLLMGLAFLVAVSTPAWAPLTTKVDEPKPKPPKDGGSPNVVDLSDKKSQVPKIPPMPPPKKETQSPKK
jgi:hypothetical protein